MITKIRQKSLILHFLFARIRTSPLDQPLIPSTLEIIPFEEQNISVNNQRWMLITRNDRNVISRNHLKVRNSQKIIYVSSHTIIKKSVIAIQKIISTCNLKQIIGNNLLVICIGILQRGEIIRIRKWEEVVRRGALT